MRVQSCLFVFFSLMALGLSQTIAQSATPDDKVAATATPSPSPANYIKELIRDQKKIFESPRHIGRSEMKWIVPLAVTTAVLIESDRKTSSWVSPNGTLASASHLVSWGGNVFVATSFATGLYAWGKSHDDRRLQKTGKLSFEALVGTSLVIALTKNIAERTHPNADNGRGQFFQEGKSFPSGHSSDAWAVATVIGYEYHDRPIIKYAAFASAIAISLARYSGRSHFMSEVLVGSAIGYGTGRFVYSNHH
jgi:membrane-associated phospholipid phosphatase